MTLPADCTLHRRRCLAAIGAAIAAPALAQTRADSAITIGGTGAGLGMLQRVFEGRAGLRFVSNLGTGGGIKALSAGALDIALAARRLTDAERATGLVDRQLLRTPLVWATHAAVKVERVSSAELAALYAGRQLQWPGGEPVRLVLRPEADADTRQMRSTSQAFADALTAAHARPGVHVAITDMDASEAIERIPGALGISTLGLLRAERRRVKVIELDGVAPSVESMDAGRWAHVRTVYVVTRSRPPGAIAEAVASFTTDTAARTLAELGCRVVQA